MFIKKTLLSCFIVFGLLFNTSVLAETKGSADSVYESIKVRYMRLRNTDRNIQKQAEWESVINSLEGFAKANKANPHAPVALSQAAGMSLEMYKALKSEKFLDRSAELFALIGSSFSGSNEADDALMKLSEIHFDYKKDKQEAIKDLKTIVDRYSNGDMIEAAQLRLKQLEAADVEEENTEDEEDDEDEEEKVEADDDAAKTVAKPDSKLRVILDPGHGGEDFGAVGVGGLYEKDVVLDVSYKVKKILESKYQIEAELTRKADDFVPLYERTAYANENNATVFVSIHANASEKKNLEGLEVYYLDNTSDKASKKLADRENASMQYEGPEADLRYMLSDMIQDSKLQDSLRLAGTLSSSIMSELSAKGIKIKNHGIKKAPFYVLVGAYMPCILIEIGFIDHVEEGQKLGEKSFRNSVAEAVADGISKYLNKH